MIGGKTTVLDSDWRIMTSSAHPLIPVPLDESDVIRARGLVIGGKTASPLLIGAL